jgi:L-lactate dehydrogenase complex protein LldG
MSARENILARIRTNSGKQGTTTEQELVAARAVISARTRGPLPTFAQHEPIKHFIEECDRLKTTLAEVHALADVPAEIARYLSVENLEKKLAGWAEFSALNWASVDIDFANRAANANDLVGLTGCFCAIGETGTLLLLGALATPKVTALLPETHICVVKKSRIVPTMEDAFQLMRDEIGEPPRATFFVSGPSRTADIEQTIVIGAHGPYRVHVVLIL